MNLKRKFIPNCEGAFESVPHDVYRAAPGLSKSDLMPFRECPAKFKAVQDGKVAAKQTKAMEYGTILHAVILENEHEYHVRPDTYPAADGDKPWRANAVWCADWLERHQDKPVLSKDEAAEVRLVARTVRNHPLAWPLLKGSRREVSLFANYGTRLMKGRLDALNDGHICDIKKVADASSWALSKSILDYGHHIQAGLYWKLCQLLGIRCDKFYFIAIELGQTTGDQCLLNVRELSTAAMELGLHELDKMLADLGECERANLWPDYSGAALGEIDLPNYAYGDAELVGVDQIAENLL